ncbi:biotin-dependent carboxyltransferase family protein [Ureibacillus aquaedulcis]|uniref:Biotin-dependent carboxyltransferase family protein n=1 Tax=Ureibacillus aquaedulcis TaxID=3058421 RepID=A0ABT8GW01_9BACL|nr:biotin-dependent carboxyltransferase family protein [Ureibacillus sp. BA0131]MDN4495594.1 biotin-dependent carboxyltransferase family protein [Ureibacillus sp. BA0131]
MKPLLKVTRHGVYASIQDKGRFGYRAQGIPVSGAMDRFSFEMGNQILNNSTNAACLEIFHGGFEFEALSDHTYVLAGAGGDYFDNGVKIDCWKSFRLFKGDRLSIKGTVEGSILYLIPQGGFRVDPILNSRSNYPTANIGELLEVGSILYGHDTEPIANTRGLMPKFRPQFDSSIEIHIFKGPHFELFTQESRDSFLQDSYQFTGGNRMGYYFKGEKLVLREKKDIISEATQFGTIQVPASGDPIVLMADAQTVGGYPIIGTVHEEDLYKIAQLRTFGNVKFRLVED